MSVCKAVAGIQPHFLFGSPAVRFVGTLQANHLEYLYFFDKCGPGWSEDDICQGVDWIEILGKVAKKKFFDKMKDGSKLGIKF